MSAETAHQRCLLALRLLLGHPPRVLGGHLFAGKGQLLLPVTLPTLRVATARLLHPFPPAPTFVITGSPSWVPCHSHHQHPSRAPLPPSTHLCDHRVLGGRLLAGKGQTVLRLQLLQLAGTPHVHSSLHRICASRGKWWCRGVAVRHTETKCAWTSVVGCLDLEGACMGREFAVEW